MTDEFKLEIFVPKEYVIEIRDELSKVNAGHVGNYDHVASITKVTGYWRPLKDSNPYSGEVGQISSEEEVKLEVRCKGRYVKDAIKVIMQIHPYEEPVINVIPLWNSLFM